MIEDLLVVVSNDAARRPKAIIIKIRKKYAFSNVLQAIGEDDQVE